MSGPTRQRSLKDRLKDGIGLSLQRRRTAQSSNSVKNSKPYVIPTGNKTKSGESHGCPSNPSEWNSMNKKNIGFEEMINVQGQQQGRARETDHKLLFKSASEADAHHEIPLDREKRQVTRTMTQPVGTTTYTVHQETFNGRLKGKRKSTPKAFIVLISIVIGTRFISRFDYLALEFCCCLFVYCLSSRVWKDRSKHKGSTTMDVPNPRSDFDRTTREWNAEICYGS